MLPIGVIEKHGAHLPLNADLLAAREVAVRAAQREYAVIFPPYYFGQVYETKHYPGGVAIEPGLLIPLLQSVCGEIARNGFNKILIVNGHGGNLHWLSFFCQIQLAERRDYAVYVVFGGHLVRDQKIEKRIERKRKTDWGGHADEMESSVIMAIRPDLVKLDRAGDEDGRPRKHLQDLLAAETGVWWYADFPEHYAGDARAANAELGELALEGSASGLAEILGSVKKDKVAPKLQAEFFAKAERPLAGRRRRKRQT
jgi:creatinine amidohydrolase